MFNIYLHVKEIYWDGLVVEAVYNDFYSSVQQRMGHYMQHC